MSFFKSLFSTSDKDEKNKMKIEYKTIIIGAKKELICTVKNNELLTSFLITDGMSFYENIISIIDNVLNGNKENDELSMNIHKLEVNKNITKIIDKLSENRDTTEVETSALKSVLEEYAAKRQKFESENYVNYTSKDNNMIIKLPKEYKKDDVADYDFYAGYEDKLYLGMYVYNLDEYKGYTENQILNEQFSIMSKSRKMKVILNNQIKKYQNKITNTVVYLSKREGYVDTVISMSTIRFYSMPNYIVYVVQTCNEDYYNKNKEIIMTNLANIEPNDKENNLKEELNNKIIKENNDYILSESGDFNLYLNYTDKVDFNGIQKFFEKYGLNVDVDYEKEDGYTRFSIYSRTDKEAITPEFYCYGEKYNQYINDMIEDAKADDEYDSKFEKEVNNLKKANSYYMISIHSKEEAKYLLYIALYLAEQTDCVMIFDCYKGRYLCLEDIKNLLNENKDNKIHNDDGKISIKDDAFGELNYYDDYYMSDVELEIFDKTVKSQLMIYKEENQTKIDDIQCKTYNLFIKEKKMIEEQVLEKILYYYNHEEKYSYGPDRDDEEFEIWWPEINTKEDLKKHIELETIVIPFPSTMEIYNGRTIYLLFNRDWGGEDLDCNGVAVRIVNEQVVEVGYKDMAY